jgi:hypothetical protein
VAASQPLRSSQRGVPRARVDIGVEAVDHFRDQPALAVGHGEVEVPIDHIRPRIVDLVDAGVEGNAVPTSMWPMAAYYPPTPSAVAMPKLSIRFVRRFMVNFSFKILMPRPRRDRCLALRGSALPFLF